MSIPATRTWWVPVTSALVAMLVAISATFWMLQPESLAPTPVVVVPPSTLDGAQWARLLGQTRAAAVQADATGPAADANVQAAPFRLWGVVSDARGGGYALIGVGDEMPASFAPGQRVQDGWVVRAVFERSVQLKPVQAGGATLTLQLPPVDEVPSTAVGVSP